MDCNSQSSCSVSTHLNVISKDFHKLNVESETYSGIAYDELAKAACIQSMLVLTRSGEVVLQMPSSVPILLVTTSSQRTKTRLVAKADWKMDSFQT